MAEEPKKPGETKDDQPFKKDDKPLELYKKELLKRDDLKTDQEKHNQERIRKPGQGWQEPEKPDPTKKKLAKPKALKKVLWDKELFKKQEGYWGPEDKGEENGDRGGISGSAGAGYYKAEGKSEISVDLKNREANLNLVKLDVQGSLAHVEGKGKFDLGSWYRDKINGTPLPPAALAAGPLAARVGDPTGHGSPLGPGIGSPNVRIGGMPAWRATLDVHTCPVLKAPPYQDGSGTVLQGAPTVRINKMPACRVGDLVVEAVGGPNPIVFGCATVLIGPKARPKKPEPTRVQLEGKEGIDVGTGKAGLDVGATINKDEKVIRAKAEAMASVAQGTWSGSLSIPIPFTKKDLAIGGEVTLAFLSAGAAAAGSLGWTKDDGYHLKAGAKAGAGLAGVGAGFSLSVK